VLSMLLNVDNVGAERMSSGRLFQAIGPCSHTKCTVTAGRRAERLGRVETGVHISFR